MPSWLVQGYLIYHHHHHHRHNHRRHRHVHALEYLHTFMDVDKRWSYFMTSHAVLFSSTIRTTCCPLISTSLATLCRNPPRMARYTNRPRRFPRNRQEASRHPSSRPSKRVPNRRLLTLQLRRLNRIRRVSIVLSFMLQTKRELKALSVLNVYFIRLHQQMHFVLSFDS